MIDLNDWKNGIAIFSMEKMTGGVGLDCGYGSGDHCGPDKFDMRIRLPSGDASGQFTVSYQRLSERTRSLSGKYCCTELQFYFEWLLFHCCCQDLNI